MSTRGTARTVHFVLRPTLRFDSGIFREGMLVRPVGESVSTSATADMGSGPFSTKRGCGEAGGVNMASKE